MFNIDPRQRPTIDEVVYHLENIAETKSIQLSPRLKFFVTNNRNLNQASDFSNTQVPLQSNSYSSQTADSKWIGSAANIFKGGIKTIKEASSKVIDTMQQYACFSFCLIII